MLSAVAYALMFIAILRIAYEGSNIIILQWDFSNNKATNELVDLGGSESTVLHQSSLWQRSLIIQKGVSSIV